MSSSLIVHPEDKARTVLRLLFSGNRREILEGLVLDESLVTQVDPLIFLKRIYSLPENLKSIIAYWCRSGTLVGVDIEGILTPSGSILLDLSTYREAKSIVDLMSILEVLRMLGLCLVERDYAYLPGFFYFSDHVMLTSQDESFEKRVDEVMSFAGDIAVSRLALPLLDTYILDEYESLQKLYAEAISRLGRYFFSKFVTYVENLAHVPSIVPIVFDTPVDLVVVTEHDIIAHKFVAVEKTLHRGYTAATRYVEYGFDKVVIVHYVEEKLPMSVCRSTLVTLLTRALLQWVGYVVVKGYEIDKLLVLKVPTYNRAVERFGSKSIVTRLALRQHFLKLR